MKTTYNTLFDKQQRRKQELTSSPDPAIQSACGSVNQPTFRHVSVNQLTQLACVSAQSFSFDSVIQFLRVLVKQSLIASIIESAIASIISSAVASIIESAVVSVSQLAIAQVSQSAVASVIQQAVASIIESAIASVIQSASAPTSQSLYADQPQDQSEDLSLHVHQLENQSSQSPHANSVNQ
jgi:large-conductance mechanosensitive channel